MASLNSHSLWMIQNIVDGYNNNPKLSKWRVKSYIYDNAKGVWAVETWLGNSMNLWLFFPDNEGKINSICVYGSAIQDHYNTLNTSKKIFGLSIKSIYVDYLDSTGDPFLDIYVDYDSEHTQSDNSVKSNNYIDHLLGGSNYPPKGSISFTSTDHIRYQNGQDVSGHNYGCKRRFVIENNVEGGEGYTVTLYNLDGLHPVWQNNVQMAPKQMRIVSVNKNIVEMRGYGTDMLGSSFSDYGLVLLIDNRMISRIQLNMYDRNICIVYVK